MYRVLVRQLHAYADSYVSRLCKLALHVAVACSHLIVICGKVRRSNLVGIGGFCDALSKSNDVSSVAAVHTHYGVGQFVGVEESAVDAARRSLPSERYVLSVGCSLQAGRLLRLVVAETYALRNGSAYSSRSIAAGSNLCSHGYVSHAADSCSEVCVDSCASRCGARCSNLTVETHGVIKRTAERSILHVL